MSSKLVELMLFLNEQSVMVLFRIFIILKNCLNMLILKCLVTCSAKIIVSITFYRLQEKIIAILGLADIITHYLNVYMLLYNVIYAAVFV
jgi:hypothetical protein